MAEYLGIEGATQPSDQFGDVILASVIGCSKKHVLTLSVPQFKQFDRYYSALRYQRLGAAFAALGIIGYAASLGVGMYAASDKQGDIARKNWPLSRRSTI